MSSSASASAPSLADKISPTLLKHNLDVIAFCRIFLSIFTGCCCGILGFTGFGGFLFYFITAAFATGLLYLKCDGKLNEYFQNWSAIIDGIGGGLLSFVLFWTLLYDIVYIY